MTTLASIGQGKMALIKFIDCGQRLKSRLCSLGMLKDQQILIIKNDMRGPILVQVFDSKIVIGRGQAEKIIVKEC